VFGKLFLILPRDPRDLNIFNVRWSGRSSDQEVYEKIFKVRRNKVLAALYWFVEHTVLFQECKVIIDPSNLDWTGDDDEIPEDDDLGPSPDQTLMDHIVKIEGVDFEVSGTLGNTYCTIPMTEDAEILDEIQNSHAENDKGTTIIWPSFSETNFRI
jgi:hypothetical protein